MPPSLFAILMSFSVREQSTKVERWFKKFKSDNTNLEDEEERGRSSDFDNAALLETVEGDESLTTRMLVEHFDVDHSTIFLVTGDESWLLFKNIKRKKVCVGQIPKGIPKDVHCKKAMWCFGGIDPALSTGRLWRMDFAIDVKHEWRIPDRNGKRQSNLNSDVYMAQLDRLEAAIKDKRSRKKNHIVFHYDNARPYVEGRIVQSINDK
uniref:Transposase n=1 Tax=Acrobeloides nanus TaxID=290746 RepID=A0A914CF45_9BILA